MGLSSLVFDTGRSSLGTVHEAVGAVVPHNEKYRMDVLAILVGIIAGIGAVAFRVTIWIAQELFYGTAFNPGDVEFTLIPIPSLFEVVSVLGPFRYLLIPAVGGLIVGLLIVRTSRDVSGSGVANVLESILVRGGQMDPKLVLYKTIASSIAIGSGGSLGREGPIVQIGSAAGSYFGQFLNRKSYTRTLVAAGAAGGIAGTFNAPLAGVMFALEVLLAEYYLRNVIAVVLSAVMATAIARPLLDFTSNPGVRAFLVPIHYQLVDPIVEMPLYILLGLFVALGGSGMVKLLYAVDHFFERFDAPFYLKPAIGGLLLGVSALFTAVVLHVSPLQSATWLFGVGYSTIRESLQGNLVLPVMLTLFVMKCVGFSLSVGSGNSGGVFSPTLYVGAMIGGAFGVVVHGLLPGMTASSGAYALVAMGGVFAASARAPLTATLVIFELTGQYTIILPLLLVSVLGSELSHSILHGSSVYTQRLRDRGYTVQERRIGSLEDLCASDVMTVAVDTLPKGASLEEAVQVFEETGHHGLPIVDDEKRLVGIITLSDLETTLKYTRASFGSDDTFEIDASLTVEEIGTTDVFHVYPFTNLLSVVDKMESSDIGRIPVVDRDGTLMGIITRSDVLDAYDDIPVIN